MSKPNNTFCVVPWKAVRERYAQLGLEPVGGTPEDIARQYREDFVKYGRLIKELGIRAD